MLKTVELTFGMMITIDIKYVLLDIAVEICKGSDTRLQYRKVC